MFDDEQIDWLIDALTASEATFKFIVAGGQILNPAAKFEVMATYPEERQKLLERIRESKVNGIMLLTGDRHMTEMAVLKENAKNYPLYELTSSSLTSGTANLEEDELNYLRIPETLVVEHSFCVLELTGAREDRKLKIICYDAKGLEKWNKTISAKDLKY
jgi:alkaline phosphatase D